jgi:UDP-3-O-[3-hydroxymyristoyl] glucosamine N-acyltransferase
VYWGTPAQNVRAHLKEMASIKQIPNILKQLKN